MKTLITIITLLVLTAVYSTPSPAQTFELDYSTYLGGSDGSDCGKAVAIDSNYNIIVAGYTFSNNFPTVNPYQSTDGGGSLKSDAFLTSISSSGTTLIYSTYLGGSGSDHCESLAVDSLDRPYLFGYTLSDDFPTKDCFQASRIYGHEAFVTRFTPSGSALSYSTYLGGSGTDVGYGISVSGNSRAHLTGITSSTDFPTVNPYQGEYGGGSKDAFLSILSNDGSELTYSTFLGGSNRDEGCGIALNTGNRVYLAGFTESTDFPVLNPYQSSYAGGYDAFFTAFSFRGGELRYSTYLGGQDDEWPNSLSLTSDNQAWLTGWTKSTDFPIANPYQSSYGGGDHDIFISRLSSTGSMLLSSSYLGGSGSDTGESMALDSFGSPCLTGSTYSEDFPTVNPYQSSWGGGSGDQDAFLIRLSSSGSALGYSTYLGGDGIDYGFGITIDDNNRAYLTGKTSSDDFPTLDPYQASREGTNSAFVSRFQLITPTPTPIGFHTPTPTITPNPTASPSTTPTPSVTPTSSVTPTPSITPTPTLTPTPSAIPTIPPPTPHSPLPIIDFNGDGTGDIAIFRKTSGLWAIRGLTRIYFGGTTDEIVPGDYDGDGTTDIGIFRESSGLWAIRGLTRIYFGATFDQPIQGDYNGSGTAVPGIFRKSSGLWAIRGITRTYFGSFSDYPVPGYYDADAIEEIGIFRRSSGLWAIRGITRVYFGSIADQTVPGNYTGDRIWTPGIFRPASGLWAIRGTTRIYFGSSFDLTVPGDYIGDGTDEIGIFRETSGLWAVRGVTRVYYGSSGDTPVVR